jgi:hypothetical protein
MNEQDILSDPRGLLQGGEELATAAEIASVLGCSPKALRRLLHGPLYERVRFVRYHSGPTRYCVTDARAAVEPYVQGLEARRQCAMELERQERAAKSVRVAAIAAKHAAWLAAKASRSRRRAW